MYDSHWRQFLKDRGGLILTSSMALAFMAVTIMTGVSLQWETNYDAARNSANYAEDARNDVAAKCGALTGQARNDCSDEINDAARENQREEGDLAAQQTMALWTAVMGGMAVVGVSLSGIGVYLIWQTWGETQNAAKAGQEANRIALSTQRPWINFDIRVWRFTFAEGVASIKLMVEAKNDGNSPAQRVSIVPYFEPGETSQALIFNRVPLMFGTEQHHGWHERMMFHGEEWRYECEVQGTGLSEGEGSLSLVVSMRYQRPGSYRQFHYTTKIYDLVDARTDSRIFNLSDASVYHRLTAKPRDTWPATCS